MSQRAPDKQTVNQTILEVCSKEYISLEVLAILLKRSSESLRKHYLNPLVKTNLLVRAYPTKPNHPKQAYKKRI